MLMLLLLMVVTTLSAVLLFDVDCVVVVYIVIFMMLVLLWLLSLPCRSLRCCRNGDIVCGCVIDAGVECVDCCGDVGVTVCCNVCRRCYRCAVNVTCVVRLLLHLTLLL